MGHGTYISGALSSDVHERHLRDASMPRNIRQFRPDLAAVACGAWHSRHQHPYEMTSLTAMSAATVVAIYHPPDDWSGMRWYLVFGVNLCAAT